MNINSVNTQKPGRPAPNAKETRALIAESDQDMFLAQSRDNSSADTDKRPGIVFITEQPNQAAYERYFEGDSKNGNICENSRKTTEFAGDQVKITYRTAFAEDGRLGDDVDWIVMDRKHPESSKSGTERKYVEDCA